MTNWRWLFWFLCQRISAIFNFLLLWIRFIPLSFSHNRCFLLVTFRAQINGVSIWLLTPIHQVQHYCLQFHRLQNEKTYFRDINDNVGIHYKNLIPWQTFKTTCTMLTFLCLINTTCSFLTPILTFVSELFYQYYNVPVTTCTVLTLER